jgi:hypothetical protein
MFTDLLPKIRAQARFAFRHLKPEAKAEAVEEVIANAFVAYRRLEELGKVDLAYPTPLAQYAIKQYRDGRRVGCKPCGRDVLSPFAQQRKRFNVASLDRQEDGEWVDALIPDGSRPIPDQVAFKIDFPDWLDRQTARTRCIALALAMGYRGTEVAKRFDVSGARITHIRHELCLSWDEFQGEAHD